MVANSLLIKNLLKRSSPFAGRTFISIYIPGDVPTDAVSSQLKNEINRTEQSTNWQIKGLLILMFKQIVEFLEKNYPETIPSPGLALFSIPLDHLKADIITIKPFKGFIDLFTLNIEEFFYINPDYFPMH